MLLKAGKKFLRWNGEFQTRHSLISTTPRIGNHEFNWVTALEARWPAIRQELDRLLEHPEDIPAFHQISPDQKRISKGDNWKTFGLFVYGQRVDENCAICPHTAQAVSEIPACAPPCFRSLSRTITSSPQRPDSCRGARAFGIDRAKGSGKALDPRRRSDPALG
ncbi:aspartyl/asparaginyl beta-hydroxylase domain-containing protein [Serratia ureilytica]